MRDKYKRMMEILLEIGEIKGELYSVQTYLAHKYGDRELIALKEELPEIGVGTKFNKKIDTILSDPGTPVGAYYELFEEIEEFLTEYIYKEIKG